MSSVLWHRYSASSRTRAENFEGKGSLTCGHPGALHTCIRMLTRRTSSCMHRVLAVHLHGPRSREVCKTSAIYPPGLGYMVGRTIRPYSIQESMSKSSPSAKSNASVLTALAHLSPWNTSELSSIWKLHDTRVENMKKYQNCRRSWLTVNDAT